MNMQRDAFVVALVVLFIGVMLIPISQLPKTEVRDRLVEKQTLPILAGEAAFEVSLQSDTRYQLAVKGDLITLSDPVRISVLAPDNSSINVEFPAENPKAEFKTLESSGYYNFTFESAYAGPNTRAEISKIVSWEIVVNPYYNFLYVGIAFIIVGTVFIVVGLKYPIVSKAAQ
ncbi:MAG: hypothetical protein JSV64_02005 [Candidatus Bathyarchaeota archaeon]|nr:MAG: hypothetical protein JSV64_02005 [Candidatus Bathyarchaeota archaeon]